MKIYKNICNRLSESISDKRRKLFYEMLNYAGIGQEFDFYLGRAVLLSLLFGLIGFLVPFSILKNYLLVYFFPMALAFIGLGFAFAFFAIAAALEYLYIYYRIENRKARVEGIFPDFLLLVASNLRAGMTPYSSLRAAARPEFAPLSEEIKYAASRALGTESFSEALKHVSGKIKSRVIYETITFFAIAMKSGGHLARMLEEAASSIKQTDELKKEISSATRMYVLFVIFIIVFAAPVLFSLSVKFVDMMAGIAKSSSFTGGNEKVITISSGTEISRDFVFLLSSAMLLFNAFFTSLFLGILQKGRAKLGLKYFPIIFALSYAIFVAANSIMQVAIKSQF